MSLPRSGAALTVAVALLGANLVSAPTALAAGDYTAKQARAAARDLPGDDRECIESAIGKGAFNAVQNRKPTKYQVRVFFRAAAVCTGGAALPCTKTNAKSAVNTKVRRLPNIVTYQSAGLSPQLQPLQPGQQKGFWLADPSAGALPDRSHLLTFTGDQTAQGTQPGQAERSPSQWWMIPALSGQESSVTATATGQYYELPNTWQSPGGLGVVGWRQIIVPSSGMPMMVAIGRSTTSAPGSQNNALHLWLATDANMSAWQYSGQLIDADSLRNQAGGSLTVDPGYQGARISSVTYAPTADGNTRLYVGLESNTAEGNASAVLSMNSAGVPSLSVDPGARATGLEEARVFPLYGPELTIVGYAMGTSAPDGSSCLLLSRDGLNFGDPITGEAGSNMVPIISSTRGKVTTTRWLSLGTKSGPDVTDGITAAWVDATVRKAPPVPRYSIGDRMD